MLLVNRNLSHVDAMKGLTEGRLAFSMLLWSPQAGLVAANSTPNEEMVGSKGSAAPSLPMAA